MSTWKREIVQKLSLKKNIIFIGVHNRRTDFSHHYEIVSQSTLVDEVYFNTAFEIYRYYMTRYQAISNSYFNGKHKLAYNPDISVHNIKIFLGINTMMIKIKLSFWQLVTIISGSR